MVALNFQGQFAKLVAIGIKRQTIRRTARVRVGDRLQLYTGQRTPNCVKLIALDPVVSAVMPCRMDEFSIRIGEATHTGASADYMARADGFKDYAEMWGWFRDRYSADIFNGQLIQWQSYSETRSW